MNRVVSAALLSLVVLAGTACGGPDMDLEPLECLGPDISHGLSTMFDDARASEADRAEMAGLCSLLSQGCGESAPLVEGGEYPVAVSLRDADADASLALTSSDDATVAVPSTQSVCGVAYATLVAASAGQSTIGVGTVGPSGFQELDRFLLEVAAASSIRVSDPKASEGKVHHVGDTFELVAAAIDAENRVLAVGTNTEWSLADDGVLAPAGSSADFGSALFVTAQSAGSTTVTVALGTLQATVDVDVIP